MGFLELGPRWGSKHEGAVVGTLRLEKASQAGPGEALEALRLETEAGLQARYKSREELAALPVQQHYKAYYKQFKKSYHVLFQLESVALKGKSIPSFNPLVTAMFIAELKNMLLTAGHDLERVEGKVRLDLAEGDETYSTLSGQEKTLKAGDMYTADERGILSSIIYGPDARTKIGKNSEKLLFVVYAPPGIGEGPVVRHLEEIGDSIALIAPGVERGAIECAVAE